MPIMHGSRLENLRKLRDRIDREIRAEETAELVREKARKDRAKEQAAKEKRLAREREIAERMADKIAARQARRAEHEREHLAHLAEVAAIEEAAPADLVRAWARSQGIRVADRGRLPLELRKRYLDAISSEGEPAA